MKKDFWIERWERGETGFHQNEINPYLIKHWQDLHPIQGCKVFVPLCGMSQDMVWLRNQGFSVLGIELSPIAVTEFFTNFGHSPLKSRGERFDRYEADNVSIILGDYFNLVRDDLLNVNVVYDRASMIALPPEMRANYVRHLVNILPTSTQILLVTIDYPQEEMTGPPFAVSNSEVEALYRDYAEIRLLSNHDVLDMNPRFQKRGLSRMHENIILLTLR